MLVLSGKKNESIVIADIVELVIVEIRGDKVKLGFNAPDDINIDRLKVWEAKRKAQASQEETK